MKFKNRIIGEGVERPDQLLANPHNFRTHPTNQREALRGILGEVGWVQRVIVNKRTGNLVDGHARVEEALRTEQTEIPVLYVDLSEAEERLVLAALDPLSALAGTDTEKLEALLHEVSTNDPALMAMLDELAQDAGIVPPVQPAPPEDFQDYGEDIETEHCCPSCGYRWSGKANAAKGNDE